MEASWNPRTSKSLQISDDLNIVWAMLVHRQLCQTSLALLFFLANSSWLNCDCGTQVCLAGNFPGCKCCSRKTWSRIDDLLGSTHLVLPPIRAWRLEYIQSTWNHFNIPWKSLNRSAISRQCPTNIPLLLVIFIKSSISQQYASKSH